MEMRDRVRQDIERLGEKTTAQLLYFAPVARMVTELRPSDNDIVWLATAFHIISSYASQDPTPFHFVLSRDCLKTKNIIDDRAVHMLASELVIHCKRLHEFISDPFSKEKDRRPVVRVQDDKGFLMPVRDAMPKFVCELNECNHLDLLLAEFLRSIGARGLEAADYIEKTAKDSFKPYRESGYETIHRPAAWSLWITPSPNASIFIGAMEILAEVVWIDVCRKRWERSIQYPATPKAVLRTAIRPPLMPGAKVEIVENNIKCFSEDGREVAFVPAVGQGHITIISRGLKDMSSLAGHQIIRWLIESGFKNWAAFKQDPRLIEVDGGYSRICELAGCGSSNTTRRSVKAILFGMEYSQFCLPNGTRGSLISTAVRDRYRNNEPTKIDIVLGPMLLPNFGQNLPSGEGRRLVPIVRLPPLIGSPNLHAPQALLQLFVLEEFSDQSNRLAEQGSVLMPLTKWQELAELSALPSKQLHRVIDGWTEPKLSPFILRDGDEYTLGPQHQEALAFLIDQGRRRLTGSTAGKRSAQTRKHHRKRGFRSPKPKGT